jgi:type IV pilus assembly protein PilX
MLQKKQKIKAGFYSHAISSQRGVILIVALVMLLVMTLMGITTLSGATLQERMSGNSRQQMVARINAEGALRAGQAFLNGLGGVDGIVRASDFEGLFLTPNDELYMGLSITDIVAPDPHAFDITDPVDWATGTNSLIAGPAMNNAANQPRYIIEYIGRYVEGSDAITTLGTGDVGTNNQQPFIFRIIGIGWGQNQNVFSVLQATYITIQG